MLADVAKDKPNPVGEAFLLAALTPAVHHGSGRVNTSHAGDLTEAHEKSHAGTIAAAEVDAAEPCANTLPVPPDKAQIALSFPLRRPPGAIDDPRFVLTLSHS